MKMLKLIILILSLSISLQAVPNEEFRATWSITWHQFTSSGDVETLKAKTRDILDKHVEANMNAVLWHARQGGTVYYPSAYEPWGSYIGYKDPGYDPLAYAVEEAHKRGLELHAWFNTFQVSSTDSGTIAAENPDWICRDQDGYAMTSSRACSPGMKAVRDYTLNVALEIVNNYDIDGIHFDYVRWNEYSNSKSSQDLAQLAEKEHRLDGQWTENEIHTLTSSKSGYYRYDIEHPYSAGVPSGYSSWEDYWRGSVNTFIAAVHDSVQAVKPWVRVSVAALGKYRWGGWQGYGSVFQDAAKWFNEGSVDQLTPMHYHWTTASSFMGMLSTDGSESWEYWIGDGIAAGRLFSAGPGSYILEENNVWNNHASIINTTRSIDWLDGYQFFSYGSWNARSYWEEASETFFADKTKIRTNPAGSNYTTPIAPILSIKKNSDFSYTLQLAQPAKSLTNQWYTLYRSTSQNFNPDSSHIEDIILPSEEYSYEKTYDGLQNYQGSDYFTLTVSDRFHNESPLSNIVSTDSLISHPCTIISNITNNDTIDINTTFIFTFDKSINMEDFESKFTISPVLDNIYYKWENPSWKNGRKQISISFPGNLAFSTNYTVTIPGNITDDSGMLIDGNNDGSEGGDFSLTFKTEDVDLSGPLLLSVNIPNPLRPNDAISLIFNENVSLDDTFDNFTLNSAGSSASFYSSVYGNMVTLKAKSQLQTNTAYTLNIIGITDTLLNPMLNDTSFTLNSSDSYLTEIKSITDFSSESGWWDPNGSGSTVGVEDESDFIYSNKNYFPGNDYVSGALNYTWTNNSTEGYLLREHCVTPVADISFDTSYTLQAYIFGDNSNNSFRFSLYENGPSIAEVSVWTPINWTGWKLVEWDLSDPSMLGEWLGDGLMNGTTYYLEGIHIKRENFDLISSTIYIDQIQLIKSSVGIIPPNFPPIMETLSDTTMVEEGSIKIYVNFEDENLTDAHIILAESDTTGVNFSIYGNTSGARVYVKPVDGFHGTTNIRIIVKDLGVGELADTSEFILTVTPLSSIDNKLPREFALMQNYPNPFNPVSNISFNLAETNQSRLDIFDIRGRLVKTLVNRQLQAGNYNFTIDMSNESSGIYFYRLQSGEFMDSKRMILIK